MCYFQESESRMSEEKKVSERRRNVIVLICRYLVNLGYFDTSAKLQGESNISLDKLYSPRSLSYSVTSQITSICT